MKIFANEILLHIVKQGGAQFTSGEHRFISSAAEVIAVYEQIRDTRVTRTMEYHFEPTDYASYDAIVADIKRYFTIVKAAGGIVTKNNQVLFMKRLGKWDLPKGKIDDGEEKREAALREVEEECGVHAEIVQKIGNTWHTYMQNKTNILKKTTWYEMVCLDDSNMKPQKSEDISKLKWVAADEEAKILSNTYNSIRHIYQKYKRIKSEPADENNGATAETPVFA
jgi:8-oxo-dGTP pyrophosphatase MutT (NUDIX family)